MLDSRYYYYKQLLIMQKNIGTQEAYIRIAVAVIVLLLALFITQSPVIKILFALLAAVLAGTAFLRTCPLNTALKRNTYDGAHEGMENKIQEITQEAAAQSSDTVPEPTVDSEAQVDTEPETPHEQSVDTETDIPEEQKLQ